MKSFDHKLLEARILIEKEYEYSKWRKEIPYIEIPQGYLIKPIPNFTGSVVRFLASNKEQTSSVSVYLDCYDELGIVGEPYWEVYPVEGDTERILMNNVEELIGVIKKAIDTNVSL